MNLVDVIKGQFTDEVLQKIGGMLGVQGVALEKLLNLVLPGLLSGLGGVASSPGGAEQISGALSKMDSSLFGDLGKMLGGADQRSGNAMESLLGKDAIEKISTMIGGLLGMSSSSVQSAIGLLGPLVLAGVGKAMGVSSGGASVARLFSEQRDNIASAVPSGLSISGLVPVMSAASSASQGAGAGRILVPLAVLLSLAASAFFVMNPGKAPSPSATPPAGKSPAKIDEKAVSPLPK